MEPTKKGHKRSTRLLFCRRAAETSCRPERVHLMTRSSAAWLLKKTQLHPLWLCVCSHAPSWRDTNTSLWSLRWGWGGLAMMLKSSVTQLKLFTEQLMFCKLSSSSHVISRWAWIWFDSWGGFQRGGTTKDLSSHERFTSDRNERKQNSVSYYWNVFFAARKKHFHGFTDLNFTFSIMVSLCAFLFSPQRLFGGLKQQELTTSSAAGCSLLQVCVSSEGNILNAAQWMLDDEARADRLLANRINLKTKRNVWFVAENLS